MGSAASGPGEQALASPRASGDAALTSYRRIKLALAGEIRALRELLERRGSRTRAARCHDLLVKLAEDRLTLAVVGQFARGKSTLMNAIVGRELLPTGVLPLTSAVTVLRFGTQERLVIQRDGCPWPQIAPLAALEEYVTERGNPGNREKISAAIVEAPLPLLRQGLEFVDTPGIGSAIAANTATTLAFLPACDAVLFVTSVDAPFTSVEVDFLQAVRDQVRKIFFVVNKIDLLSAHEGDDVLAFIDRTIREHMGGVGVRVFPVSCRQALAAKLDRRANGTVESGLEALEAALSHFLSQEKTAAFLTALLDKAIRVAALELAEIDLARRAGDSSSAAGRRTREAFEAARSAQAALRRDVFRTLREHMVERLCGQASNAIASFVVTERAALGPQLDRALARGGWRPAVVMARRVLDHARRRLDRNLRRRLARCAAECSLDTDELCREAWQQLEASIDEFPARVASALGIEPPAMSDGSNVMPTLDAPSALEFDAALAPSSPTHASVPRWLALVPTRLARPWLKRQLERELRARLDAIEHEVPAAIETRINGALEDAWDALTARAEAVESRVLVALTGEQGADTDVGPALEAVHQALLSLCAELLGLPSPAPTIKAMPLTSAPCMAGPLLEPPGAETREAGLVGDLQTRGCPVCDRLHRVALDFFSHWQYALASDRTAQTEFAIQLGFCPLHSWQLEAVSSPVGSSVGYLALAQHVARRLQEVDGAAAERAVRSMLRDARTCRVCRLLRDAERQAVDRLVALLGEARGRDTYAAGHGVCLAHLAAVIAASEPDVGRFALAHVARRFEECAEDMQAFAMKTSALRRGLGNDDERDAYWRAITHIAGAKGVALPWPGDAEL